MKPNHDLNEKRPALRIVHESQPRNGSNSISRSLPEMTVMKLKETTAQSNL
jgi:hypothetical protein